MWGTGPGSPGSTPLSPYSQAKLPAVLCTYLGKAFSHCLWSQGGITETPESNFLAKSKWQPSVGPRSRGHDSLSSCFSLQGLTAKHKREIASSSQMHPRSAVESPGTIRVPVHGQPEHGEDKVSA